jgi:sialidase-1
VRISYDECKTWAVSKVLYVGPSAYSDMAIAPDMSICCLYDRGANAPYESIHLAQFNLEWLSDGKDSLGTF